MQHLSNGIRFQFRHLSSSSIITQHFHSSPHFSFLKITPNRPTFTSRQFHSSHPKRQQQTPPQDPPQNHSTALQPSTTQSTSAPPPQFSPHADKFDSALTGKGLMDHPSLTRTEFDDRPGLRLLPKTQRSDLIGNFQSITSGPMLGDARAAQLSPSEAAQLMPNQVGPFTNPTPKDPKAIFQRIDPNSLTAAQKAEKRESIAKKVAILAIFMTGLVATFQSYYQARGAFGPSKSTGDETDTTPVDYTTRNISNQYHSVSPMAQEIIDQIITQLITPKQHLDYLEAIRPAPPVYSSESALQLPLFIARGPTQRQAAYNQIRYEQEMRTVYPDRPPLNNSTIDLYLDRSERMERDYRLSHDKEYVMSSSKPRSVAHLTDQIAFQLDLRK